MTMPCMPHWRFKNPMIHTALARWLKDAQSIAPLTDFCEIPPLVFHEATPCAHKNQPIQSCHTQIPSILCSQRSRTHERERFPSFVPLCLLLLWSSLLETRTGSSMLAHSQWYGVSSLGADATGYTVPVSIFSFLIVGSAFYGYRFGCHCSIIHRACLGRLSARVGARHRFSKSCSFLMRSQRRHAHDAWMYGIVARAESGNALTKMHLQPDFRRMAECSIRWRLVGVRTYAISASTLFCTAQSSVSLAMPVYRSNRSKKGAKAMRLLNLFLRLLVIKLH